MYRTPLSTHPSPLSYPSPTLSTHLFCHFFFILCYVTFFCLISLSPTPTSHSTNHAFSHNVSAPLPHPRFTPKMCCVRASLFLFLLVQFSPFLRPFFFFFPVSPISPSPSTHTRPRCTPMWRLHIQLLTPRHPYQDGRVHPPFCLNLNPPVFHFSKSQNKSPFPHNHMKLGWYRPTQTHVLA